MNYREITTIELDKMGGNPAFEVPKSLYTTSRLPRVSMSEAEILAEFPDLTHDGLHACVALAGDSERRLVSIPA